MYFHIIFRLSDEINEIHGKSSSDSGLMVNKSDKIEEQEKK